MKKIKIKESKKGTFTAAAKKRGMGVQEFASKVLSNKENYSSAMVKKANFARNASKWKHEEGGQLTNTEKGQMIGQGLGSALAMAGVPGLGPILGQLGSMLGQKKDASAALKNSFNQINKSVNPYGHEEGGELMGREDLMQYKGNSHSQGGIAVQQNGIPYKEGINEVEGDETVYKVGKNSYVFSKKLKL
jgi:hypothetical protein